MHIELEVTDTYMSEIFPNWTQNSIQSTNQRTCDEHVHTAVVCTNVKVSVWIFSIRKHLCKKIHDSES